MITRRKIVCYAVLSVICVYMTWLLEYLGGRNGMHLIVPPLFPATIVPIFMGLILYLFVFIRFVISLFKKLYRMAWLIALVSAVGIPLITSMLLPTRPFLIGLRQRLLNRATVEEYLAADIAIRKIIPVGESVWGPGKCKQEDDDQKRWQKLKEISCIACQDDSITIEVTPEETYLEWGGALVGHWGLRIYPYGYGPEPEPYYYQCYPINKKLSVFLSK